MTDQITVPPLQGLSAYLRCEAGGVFVGSPNHETLMQWAREVDALTAANAVSHPQATELAGWTGKSDIDAALIMLDRLDVRGEGDDARVDEISRTLRKLAAAPEAKQ